MKISKMLIVFSIILPCIIGCSKDIPEKEQAKEIVESADSFRKSITTIDSLSNIQCVIQLKDSSYMLVGGIQINLKAKNLIIKLDKYGNKEWLKMPDTHAPNGFERVFVDGNQLVAYRSYIHSNYPALVYFNNNGDVVNEFEIANSIVGYDVLQENDGYIAIGEIEGFEGVQKINKQGTVVWTEKLSDATGLSISKLPDGNFITIGGATYSGPGGDFLVKIDNAGKKIWSKTVSGYSVLALPDTGFIILAHNKYTNNIELIRFDKEGNQLWTHLTDYNTDVNSLLVTGPWLFKYGADHYAYCLYDYIPYPIS